MCPANYGLFLMRTIDYFFYVHANADLGFALNMHNKHFLGLPREIVFGAITDNLLYLQPLKNLKNECDIVKIILVQGFSSTGK